MVLTTDCDYVFRSHMGEKREEQEDEDPLWFLDRWWKKKKERKGPQSVCIWESNDQVFIELKKYKSNIAYEVPWK